MLELASVSANSIVGISAQLASFGIIAVVSSIAD